MDLNFRYKSGKTGVFTNKDKYAGAFVKISNDVVAVQPQSRRILFPHIGYPSEAGAHAITISKGNGVNDMGSFAWESINVSKFSDAEDFTYIQQTTKNTSWYPSITGAFVPLHGLLYEITGVPGSYYINGMMGKTDDTTLLQSTATTIKQSATLSYLHDTPTIMSNSNRIWINHIASPLETKDSGTPLGESSISMFSRGGDYVTVASVLNSDEMAHLIGDETYENAKAILLGYNSYTTIGEHLTSPSSNTHLDKTFVSIRVLAGHIYTLEDVWKSNALSTVVEEIDRLDNKHLELIDGMWLPLSIGGESIITSISMDPLYSENSILHS